MTKPLSFVASRRRSPNPTLTSGFALETATQARGKNSGLGIEGTLLWRVLKAFGQRLVVIQRGRMFVSPATVSKSAVKEPQEDASAMRDASNRWTA
jgi:hypothetical protein